MRSDVVISLSSPIARPPPVHWTALALSRPPPVVTPPSKQGSKSSGRRGAVYATTTLVYITVSRRAVRTRITEDDVPERVLILNDALRALIYYDTDLCCVRAGVRVQ